MLSPFFISIIDLESRAELVEKMIINPQAYKREDISKAIPALQKALDEGRQLVKTHGNDLATGVIASMQDACATLKKALPVLNNYMELGPA